MTRRTLLTGALAAPLAAQFQTPDELKGELFSLINDFIIKWNDALKSLLQNKADYKANEAAEKAFQKVTDHPAWPRRKSK